MLTERQRKVLSTMIAAEEAEAYDEAEIVCDGASCYLGLDRISRRTVEGLLRCVAISMASEPGSLERYVITETGRLIEKDPAVAARVAAAMLSGGAFDAGGNPI